MKFNVKYQMPVSPSTVETDPASLAVDCTDAALRLRAVSNFFEMLDELGQTELVPGELNLRETADVLTIIADALSDDMAAHYSSIEDGE